MNRIFAITFIALLAAGFSATAQKGDRKGQDQPEVWRTMDVPPAPTLTPAQALKTFKLAPGFRIEIAAADPLVHDPVAMAFDADGRMWVVEMRAFMPNVDGTGEDARTGRVGVLEDTNGDGKMDKRTDFLTDLQMPRAIALVKGGVLVAEPPILWFCEDTDGDLKADKKTAVLKNYATQGPVEHTDNGLMPGLDNWLYNAKSTKRLRFIDGKWVLVNTRFRGQWGITQDNYGRIYYNNNSNPLYGDLIAGHYSVRNPHHPSRHGVNVPFFNERTVWTSRVNPGINRGYQKPMLREGHLATWTAACGPVIYRGDQYPTAMVGDAFIPEPSGNMIRRQRITWKANGMPDAQNAYDKAEWLTSTDERFRPVTMVNGPDGCLYIVDMYRGILQHKVYVTSFLRKQIIERKLDAPIGLGRIYRVVHTGKKPKQSPKISSQNSSQLIAHLESDNGWLRSTAHRLLVEQANVKALPQLRETATHSESHLARQHALWILEGTAGLDSETIAAAMSDEHPRVRIAALRVAEAFTAGLGNAEADTDARVTLLTPLTQIVNDKNVDVQRQVALSLPVISVPGTEPLLRAFVAKRAGDAIIRDGLITGLAGRELEFLQRVPGDAAWNKEDKNIREILKSLAGCVARQRDGARLERLLKLAAKQNSYFQRAVLEGVSAAAFPRGRALKPVAFKSQPLAMAELAKSADKLVRGHVERLGKFLVWGEAARPPKPPRALTAAEQGQYELGKILYTATCGACHQANGLGEEGKAPPLLDSPFLVGPADRAIGIVLHGVTGPITVHGRQYNMSMPALVGFQPEQVAAILTYARREWEHRAEPVTAAQVKRLMEANARREAPWTEAELLKLK
ncbi:MAG: dehydrogenase [Verrucomicrobia subdivision 3 bacterium]|nr:dehydrogenase [Limisphaerales bacterium]